MNIYQHYIILVDVHLPTLYKYALECNSVFETCVRGLQSNLNQQSI